MKGSGFITRISPQIDVSPVEADLVLVSTDVHGTPGTLNQFVLKELGYSPNDMPEQGELKRGFYLMGPRNGGKKPILFIVTVGAGPTARVLELNLRKALQAVQLQGFEKVWIPLMGTGDGGLSLRKSYAITRTVIDKSFMSLPASKEIIISIPQSREGQALYNEIAGYEPEVPNSYAGKIYAGGSTWGNKQDKTLEFLEQGIWLNGYHDRFIEEVKTVQEGDVLILKSTYAWNSEAQFRVKALGTVTYNDGSGQRLEVDWVVQTGNIDIPGSLGAKRHTFQELSKGEVQEILQAVQPSRIELEALFQRPSSNRQNDEGATGDETDPKFYTTLRNDSALGDNDLLDFKEDIEAFASIIALEKMEPPLAIGLFGNWGTGKSFFMHNLQKTVDMLSENQGFATEEWNGQHSSDEKEQLFCKGIAQIHFNAWSYLDANLWASLVSQIFEELNIFLGGVNASDKKLEEVRRKLADQLELANEQRKAFYAKKEELAKNIVQLQDKQQKAEEQVQKKLKAIRASSKRKIVNEVKDRLSTSSELQSALSNIKIGSSDLDSLDPAGTLEELRSVRTFGRQFFSLSRSDVGWMMLALVLLLLPFLINNILDFPSVPESWAIVFGGIAAMVGKMKTAISQLSPVYQQVLTIRDRYDQEIAEELSKQVQEEKALQIEIDQQKDEVKHLQKQLLYLEEEQGKVEYAIDNTLAQRALYSFIAERSGSADYMKHLGLVSIIRKDFETLSNLFYASKDEKRKGHLQHDKQREYGEIRKEIEENCGRSLDRIVLYIDDLDRCSEDRVVEVLEAVHLLMAFPLFVVVVGVDPRWVKNALIKKYYLQFAGGISEETFSQELEQYSLQKIDSTDYLEKIFQVPFCLKPATKKGVVRMIGDLLEDSIYQPSEDQSDDAESSLLEVNSEKAPLSRAEKGMKDGIDQPVDEQSTDLDRFPGTSYISPDSLRLSKDEIDDMQAFAPLIGNTPRTIKRFINVYRIIRAHENITGVKMQRVDYQVIMFLLALPVGCYKGIYQEICEVLHEDSEETLGQYLDKKESEGEQPHAGLYADLQLGSSLGALLDEPKEVFRKHLPFIQRFSFQ